MEEGSLQFRGSAIPAFGFPRNAVACLYLIKYVYKDSSNCLRCPVSVDKLINVHRIKDLPIVELGSFPLYDIGTPSG